MKKILFIGMIIVVAVAAILFSLKNHAGEIVLVTRGHLVQAVYATGEVEAVVSAAISPQISAKITEIPVEEGEAVTEGQVLAHIEDSVEQARLDEYRARMGYLEKEKERYEALSSKDYSSKSKYEKILSDYEAVKSQIESQEKLIERMHIISPMDGVVLERNVESGETVTSLDIIFYVGQPDNLRVTAKVDEEDIPLVKIGQRVLIKSDSFPDDVFEGTVKEITPRGDPVDKNFRIRVALREGSPLLIGMTVEVNIITAEAANALLVPASSVMDGKVWLVDGRTITPTKVKTGIANEEGVQILNGLQEGQEILLNPSSME